MEDRLQGKLVRLAGIDPEEVSKSFAQWNRDSEYMRLMDTDPPRLHSTKAIKEWLEKELEKSTDLYWFAIRTLEDDRLLGDITLSVINRGSREAFAGIGMGARVLGQRLRHRCHAITPALWVHRTQPTARLAERVRVQPACFAFV